MGTAVGGIGVAVDGSGVDVGGTAVTVAVGVTVGGRVVAVGVAVAVGLGVAVGVAVGAVSVASCASSATRVWVGATFTVGVAAGPPQAVRASSTNNHTQRRLTGTPLPCFLHPIVLPVYRGQGTKRSGETPSSSAGVASAGQCGVGSGNDFISRRYQLPSGIGAAAQSQESGIPRRQLRGSPNFAPFAHLLHLWNHRVLVSTRDNCDRSLVYLFL
jgi:hypothetical protein